MAIPIIDLELHTFDIDSNPKRFVINDSLGFSGEVIYQLEYSNEGVSSLIKMSRSFEDLIKLIHAQYLAGGIKSNKVRWALVTEFTLSQRFYEKGKKM